jgi:3-oxoacyl-[acyl-carrier protein] reductase
LNAKEIGMEKRLDGKVAIITGASRGIGKAIAKLYARHGAKVIVNYRRDEEGAQRTVAEITADGGESMIYQADVSVAAETETMAATTLEHYGSIDILCANAATFPLSSIDQMTEDKWDQMINVNLKGTFLSIKACLPQMKAKQYGKIVVISSITGNRVGLGGASNYGASKAGQLGLVLCACLELAPHNITINAILPGWVATEDILRYWQGEKLARLEDEIPMHRLADPLEVAYGALFFSCNESRYITGQTLVIDGGITIPELPAALSA